MEERYATRFRVIGKKCQQATPHRRLNLRSFYGFCCDHFRIIRKISVRSGVGRNSSTETDVQHGVTEDTEKYGKESVQRLVRHSVRSNEGVI